MNNREDELLARRLEELARRADRTGIPSFTGFLSPPEAEMALAAGRKAGVETTLEGGYPDAERRMARFQAPGCFEEPFPLVALTLGWPHQSAPGHRDVLGSVMGLGVKRQCIGDIVVLEEVGYLFAERQMAGHIADSLLSAGRIKLQASVLEHWPELEPPSGVELRDTVMSLRLDAVVSGGFGLSRGSAAELITSGHVKLRHVPTERTDARVAQGDAISVRGYGRLVVTEVGTPTKKGRLPLRLMRYGEGRRH